MDATETHRVSALIGEVARIADRAVPLVGAGLSIPAGGVTGPGLIAALVEAGGQPLPEDLMAAADRFEAQQGVAACQAVVARTIAGRRTIITPALRCLARTPGRRIVTLNYDDAIEQAVSAAGLTPRSLLVADGAAFTAGPGPGEVHVLHLHGHHSHPETIVLGRRSYDQAIADARLELLVRWLASSHPLLIVGTRYSEREETLRRNLLWAHEAWTNPQRHLYLGLAEGIDPELRAAAEEGGIRFCAMPTGAHDSHELVTRALSVISPSGFERRHPGGGGTPRRCPHYLEITLAVGDDTPSAHDPSGAWWRAGRRRLGKPDTSPEDMRRWTRVALVGGAGSGKTQALVNTFDAPTDIYVWLPGAGFDRTLSPRLRLAGLIEDAPGGAPTSASHTLVLDGFDELGGAARQAVLDLLRDGEAELAPHRVVVASRPHPEVRQLDELGYTRFTVVPDATWFDEYAVRRGLAPAAVEAALAAALPIVRDLASTACFAAAIVDALVDGRLSALDDALDLLLYPQDEVTRTDGSTIVPADVRTRLLDQLALTMEARGAATATRDEIEELLTMGALVSPADVPTCIDSFLARALLFDQADGTLRFPTAHAQEARAARALTDRADARRLVETIATGVVGAHRGTRPSTRRTLQLALLRAPTSWIEWIGDIDERVALRAIAAKGLPDDEARLAAIERLWAWYRARNVWLPVDGRLLADPLLDDEFTLVRLAAGLVPPTELVDRLLDDAGAHPHPAGRVNALRILRHLGPGERWQDRCIASLGDDDPAVRSVAAGLLHDAAGARVVAALTAAYRAETDAHPREVQAQTLARVDPVEALVVLCGEGLPPLPVLRRLVRTAPVAAQLARIQQRSEIRRSDRDLWVEELVDERGDELDEQQVRTVLGLIGPRSRARSRPALRRLAERHPTPFREHSRSADPFDRQELLDLVAPRPALAAAPTTESGGADEARRIEEIVRDDDRHALCSISPAPELIAALDPSLVDAVRAQAAALWAELFGPTGFLDDSAADSEAGANRFAVTEWAAATEQPLDTSTWFEVVERIYPGETERRWLRAQAGEEVRSQLPQRIPTMSPATIDRVITILDDEWELEVARAAVAQVFAITEPGAAGRAAALSVLERIGDVEGLRVVRTQTSELDRVDEALVRVGDRDAEVRCLRRALDDVAGTLAPHHHLGEHWLDAVRQGSSGPLLVELARKAVALPDPSTSIDRIWRAIERTQGPRALDTVSRVGDGLDPVIASRLWHVRDEILGRQIEEVCLARVGPSLAAAGRMLHPDSGE